ncbi:MAG: hypothetical protein NXI27_07575 [Alphaproteobacteria bacterium]|nr:hypothetical protein [Alphaproteobacteria bacterium]
MTMIINHAAPTTAPRALGFATVILRTIGDYVKRTRTARRIRREHEMLMAMSVHDLHDIGLVRGDVVFGISSGRGVFRDMDRPDG